MTLLPAWLNVREATNVGATLADNLASRVLPDPTMPGKPQAPLLIRGIALVDFLERAKQSVDSLPLNLYKRAKLASAFRRRLLEKGFDKAHVTEATRALVLHLLMGRRAAAPKSRPADTRAGPKAADRAQGLLATASQYMGRREFGHAIITYEAFLKLHPGHAPALNYLGVALGNLGRYREAEEYFRRAAQMDSTYAEAYYNLGSALRARSQLTAAERALRQALELKADYLDALSSLGLTLIALGRPEDAKPYLQEVLNRVPRDSDALLGMGQVASMEGRFADAESLFKAALGPNQNDPSIWASLVSLRKMTSADGHWLERALRIASSDLTPMEEVNIRFAIGKYCDDVSDFERAFENYKRGNDILRSTAAPYNRDAHVRFVDDLIRVYTRDAIAAEPAASVETASASTKPALVVGMPRSGTSLVEQIVASHPAAGGAGELRFWTAAVHEHEMAIRHRLLPVPMRQQLALKYLQILVPPFPGAQCIVDKAPINSDYLGVIHTVFPNARIIHVRRDPIDTCVSCYFQQFSAALKFTMDLADLAHYYRQHQRLMAHWHAILPPGTILEVPYRQLVTDPRTWVSRILEFLELDWDERCLDFQSTERTVATASAWQVRQKIHTNSLERWRNYKKFIGPLLELQNLEEQAAANVTATG